MGGLARGPAPPLYARLRLKCGRSSVVEHNLAKVGVESSNLFARSSRFEKARSLRPGFSCFWRSGRREFARGCPALDASSPVHAGLNIEVRKNTILTAEIWSQEGASGRSEMGGKRTCRLGRQAAPLAMILILAILFAPALIGLPLAAWVYPWRKPVMRPYLWFVVALTIPLVVVLLLPALFTQPLVTCQDSPLNYLPLLVATGSVVLAAVLIATARGYRLFVTGIAIALCPPTALMSLVALMSLAGCWI